MQSLKTVISFDTIDVCKNLKYICLKGVWKRTVQINRLSPIEKWPLEKTDCSRPK